MSRHRHLSGLLVQLTKYRAVLGITVRSHLVYVGEFVLRSLFLIVVLYVFVQLWKTTYRVTGSDHIAGFSLGQIIWYLVMTESLVMAQPRLAGVMDQEVKSGQLAYTLGRPYSYLLYHYSGYLGELLVRLPVNLAIGSAVALLSVGPLSFDVSLLPFLVVAVWLGITLNFCLAASIGLLAFWFEETASFAFLYSRLVMILGGMLIPLEIFPAGLQKVARALPINLVVYWPARIFVGQVTPAAYLRALPGQVLWLLLAALLVSWVYRRGVKNAVIQGG